jgi:hypothetical protein
MLSLSSSLLFSVEMKALFLLLNASSVRVVNLFSAV